jgi:hypothetical protein
MPGQNNNKNSNEIGTDNRSAKTNLEYESQVLEEKSNQKKDKNTKKQDATNSPQTTKWILFLLLLTGVGLLSESLYEKFIPSVTQIEMQSQSHFVSRDLYEMYKKGEIPKYFFQLKNIKWSYYDEELKKQIPMESIPFKTSMAGAYNLEIDAFSSSKKTSKIAVLQMNLIEVKSGNKIWELSRNYEIPLSK